MNNILLYGGGGLGKSSRAAEAALLHYKKTGKKCRVVNADGGGTSEAFRNLVKNKIASIWEIDTWDAKGIFENLRYASRGHWPSDVNVPNSPLLAPIKEWRKCPYCDKDSGAPGLGMVASCVSCKKPYPVGTFLPVQRDPINGMEEIGSYVFEGLTAFGENMMRRLIEINPSGGNEIVDETGFKIASSGKQHYGSAQTYTAEFVSNSRRLPVDLVIWTALEHRGDDGEGKPVYGPKLPGKALAKACIPWFNSVIHLDAVPKREKGMVVKNPDGTEILERKMYLAAHYPLDAPNARFEAKTSAPDGGDMPPVIDSSMKVFFEELEKAQLKAEEKMKKTLEA